MAKGDIAEMLERALREQKLHKLRKIEKSKQDLIEAILKDWGAFGKKTGK